MRWAPSGRWYRWRSSASNSSPSGASRHLSRCDSTPVRGEFTHVALYSPKSNPTRPSTWERRSARAGAIPLATGANPPSSPWVYPTATSQTRQNT
eukprot:1177590-Prorocentrum_minimum.AAC.1